VPATAATKSSLVKLQSADIRGAWQQSRDIICLCKAKLNIFITPFFWATNIYEHKLIANMKPARP